LKGVGDGGVVPRIGVGAPFAAASLRMTTVVPETVTPPFAVPFSTGRVSVTALDVPLELRSSVAIRTCATSVLGATTALIRPASSPGIVTATVLLPSATVDPGM
jgi:hypothetical protein